MSPSLSRDQQGPGRAGRWLAPLSLAALACVAGALTTTRGVGSATSVSTQDEAVLSDSPGVHSVAPRVAVLDDGTAHVVWQEGQPGVDAGEPLILHRFRLPGGAWSDTYEVYWDGVQPSVATDGRAVGVTFVRNPFDRFDSAEVLYKLWDGAAVSWPDIPNAIQGELGVAGAQPDLAFDRQGYVWLVWINSRDSDQRPYYARILTQSREVDGAGPIDEREQGAQGPALAMDAEDGVHVVWSTGYASGEADLSRWEWPSGGRYWVNRESALYDQVREARSPDITTAGSALCVTWHEGSLTRPNEVILSCDRASGNIWFGNVSQSPGSRSLLPSLAGDEQRGAMLLWFEREQAGRLVFGQVVPPAPPATSEVAAGTTGMPSLDFHNGFAYAAWVADTPQGGSEIRFARWQVDVPTPTATVSPSRAASDTPMVSPTPSRTPSTGTPPGPASPVPTVTASATDTTPGPGGRVFTPLLARPRR